MQTLLALTAAVALVVPAGSALAASATLERSWQYQHGGRLEVDNLVGDARVEAAADGRFHVSARVTTEAETQAEAEALAAAVQFRVPDATGGGRFQVDLPEASFPRIYYDGAPSGWWGGRMYVGYLGERRRVTGDPAEGVRVRVDLLIRAPADAHLEVRNILGDSTAEQFVGELRLEGSSGSLRITGGAGRAELDTGSGEIEVGGYSGAIRADTGSGRVRVSQSEGELAVDTGSGGVVVEGFTGSVEADTGSGGVTVRDLAGAAELVIDTGSGGVRVDGDLSSLKRLDIDTGSGGVTVEASAWPSMTLVVDTGSGGVSVDIPGVETSRDEDRRQVIRLGDGSGSGRIDTGSGSVRLRSVARSAE